MLINPEQLAVEVCVSVNAYKDLLSRIEADAGGSVVLSHATLRRSLLPRDTGGARQRHHTRNHHSAAPVPDSGPEPDTGRRAPRRATTARLRPAAPARPPDATAAAPVRRNTRQPR